MKGADEFVDSADNWPPQLYIREARRMISDFVFTMHDRVNHTIKNDSIAVGDYNIDGHMIQRVLLPNGTVTNEGCLSGYGAWVKAGIPLHFEIPFSVMVPKAVEATNLLVSCAVSASHVGSGPLRLEPQYMNMGHAAGVAAALVVLDPATTVQSLFIPRLQQLLAEQGVTYKVVAPPPPSPSPPQPTTTYTCGLNRCIASPAGGYRSSACDGQCSPLGASEWLGAREAWTVTPIKGGGNVAVAKKATHLKKSTASSGTLPAYMVRRVTVGDRCNLNVDGTRLMHDLFACTLPAI